MVWLLFALSGLADYPAGVLADVTQDNLDKQRNFNAVQRIYLNGVPHTDRHGRPLVRYTPGQSFFPIGMWGTPLNGESYGQRCCDWSLLSKNGYNTVWPWPHTGGTFETALKGAKEHGLQVIAMVVAAADIKKFKDHPNFLGNVWMDEPIGKLGSTDMDALFKEFLEYRQRVHQIAPDLRVFINDAPWIVSPATSWWVKWNTAGDVSCHDNYPIMVRRSNPRSIGADTNGIPQSVSLAVASNKEQKPVWLIVGVFEQPTPYGHPFPFRYPTPTQLRAQVYAGIIHGATGIHYFIWDSYISRDGGNIGISPNPVNDLLRVNGKVKTSATPLQLVQARALWDTAAQINRELRELTPAILSPTVGRDVDYSVTVEGESPTPNPIRTLLKPNPAGGFLLLTVNLDDSVLKVTYNFPKTLMAVETLFENQPPVALKPKSGSFWQAYEPFESHIFKVALVK